MTKEQDRADELAAAKAEAKAKDTALVTDGMRADDVFNREGAWAQQAEGMLPDLREREEIQRGLDLGLEAAPTINDRRISTFVRGELPHFAGETGTFLKCPRMEDVHDVGDAEVAFFGVPLDSGATYRPGTRFGPQGIRRSTNVFGT
jgi:agmatinase